MIERGRNIGLGFLVLRFFLADGALTYGGAEPLEFRKGFVEAALRGGAIAEGKGKKCRIEVVIVEGIEFE